MSAPQDTGKFTSRPRPSIRSFVWALALRAKPSARSAARTGATKLRALQAGVRARSIGMTAVPVRFRHCILVRIRRSAIARAEFAQPLSKAFDEYRGRRADSQLRETFPGCRARRERPRGCRAAEQRDELAASHSITSSARAIRVGGISRPSILAVW